MKEYYYQNLSLEDIPGEIWKTLDFASLYQVSNMGRVKVTTCEKWHNESKRLNYYDSHIMAQAINKQGYLIVSVITNEGKHKTYRVNRLVLSAFVDNPQSLPHACHINEDKLDNRLVNLEWGTAKENNNTPLRKQRISRAMGKSVKCDGITFNSINKAANAYNVNVNYMWQWLTGRKPMPEEWKTRGLQFMEE